MLTLPQSLLPWYPAAPPGPWRDPGPRASGSSRRVPGRRQCQPGHQQHHRVADRDPGRPATLMLTVGGIRYLAAGGDPAEVQKAKIALRSAGIGYALAILAPVIVAVLKSLTGG